MKQYLICCRYSHYCQGWDDDNFGTFLVTAKSFAEACEKLKATANNERKDFCEFQNHTVE